MYSPHAGGHAPAGFPHSEISGSRPVSGSPELIAAVHVLHRLWLPRHPPYALRSLTLSLRHDSRSRRRLRRRLGIACGIRLAKVASRTLFASFARSRAVARAPGRLRSTKTSDFRRLSV